MEPLPVGEYSWVENPESLDVDKAAQDPDFGMFVECDLDYPRSLFLKTADYPLAPETMELTFDHLSPMNKRLYRQSHPDLWKKGQYKATKLMSTFYPRRRYACHIRNLAYYMSQGLQLRRIHRAIKFRQRPFLRPFIQHVTALRGQAKSKFEVRLYKNMANR